MAIIAAVEAGGTKFICGLGTEDGKIIDRINIPTTTPEETMSKVIEYFKDKEFEVMGVGSFGPIDPVKGSETYGYITKTPKAYWSDYNIIGELKKHYDVPMEFDTDVNGAALAESWWGAGKGLKNVMYITVGTGIGAGAVVNGTMLQGLTHPEMGHIFIKRHPEDNYEGNCPFHKDCLEGLAAGPAIEKRWGKKGYGSILSGTGSYELYIDFISSKDNNGRRSNETAASVPTYKKICTGIFERLCTEKRNT